MERVPEGLRYHYSSRFILPDLLFEAKQLVWSLLGIWLTSEALRFWPWKTAVQLQLSLRKFWLTQGT